MYAVGWTAALYELTEDISLEKNKKHNIEIVVDRLVIRPDILRRLTDSVETAASLGGGLLLINLVQEDRDLTFSQNYACEDCGVSIEELTPSDVLLQQSIRGLSRLHRPGQPDESRSPAGHPQPRPVHPGRRHRRLRLAECEGGFHRPDVL